MDSFKLSRNFFNHAFLNPEKIKPVHIAIYFFAIEHCNRLGNKDKFGFPSQMTMDAIGVKDWHTYIKALNELVNWGFITMLERSKNQYSSNIISIPSPDKISLCELDKAFLKHAEKYPSLRSENLTIHSLMDSEKNTTHTILDSEKSPDHTTKHTTKQTQYNKTMNKEQSIDEKKSSLPPIGVKDFFSSLKRDFPSQFEFYDKETAPLRKEITVKSKMYREFVHYLFYLPDKNNNLYDLHVTCTPIHVILNMPNQLSFAQFKNLLSDIKEHEKDASVIDAVNKIANDPLKFKNKTSVFTTLSEVISWMK